MVLIDSTLEAIANAAAATTAIGKAGSAPVDLKILSAVAAIVPIITYPFLPWDGKMDDHQLSFYLIYPGFLWIPFFHLPNLTFWLFEKDSVCLPVYFWVFPLTLCTTVVGNAGLAAKGEHRKVAPADFDDAGLPLCHRSLHVARRGLYAGLDPPCRLRRGLHRGVLSRVGQDGVLQVHHAPGELVDLAAAER